MIAPRLSIPDSPPEAVEVFLAARQFFSEHPLEQDLESDGLAERLFVRGYVNRPPSVADVQAAQEALAGIEVVA
jgi:hypothetical protein